MEIIRKGSEKVTDLKALGCCWPPGTLGSRSGAPSPEQK